MHSSKSGTSILTNGTHFDDTLDRETLKHTMINSRMGNVPLYSQEQPNFQQNEIEEYDSYQPEINKEIYGMGPKTSIVLQLYEDVIIRFDTVNQTYYDFPQNGVLGTINPSYCQVNENGTLIYHLKTNIEIVMAGGKDKYRPTKISPRTMLYNVRTCKLFRLKDMLTPRKHHAMVAIDYY